MLSYLVGAIMLNTNQNENKYQGAFPGAGTPSLNAGDFPYAG